MSAPTSLTGELLDLVAQTQATRRRAYDELHAANERGPVGADLEAFSAAMRERDRAVEGVLDVLTAHGCDLGTPQTHPGREHDRQPRPLIGGQQRHPHRPLGTGPRLADDAGHGLPSRRKRSGR